jgi:hypothetical protein
VDSSLIANLVDLPLVVVRTMYTKKGEFEEALNKIAPEQFAQLRAVLNSVDDVVPGYYGGYYYYYNSYFEGNEQKKSAKLPNKNIGSLNV